MFSVTGTAMPASGVPRTVSSLRISGTPTSRTAPLAALGRPRTALDGVGGRQRRVAVAPDQDVRLEAGVGDVDLRPHRRVSGSPAPAGRCPAATSRGPRSGGSRWRLRRPPPPAWRAAARRSGPTAPEAGCPTPASASSALGLLDGLRRRLARQAVLELALLLGRRGRGGLADGREFRRRLLEIERRRRRRAHHDGDRRADHGGPQPAAALAAGARGAAGRMRSAGGSSGGSCRREGCGSMAARAASASALAGSRLDGSAAAGSVLECSGLVGSVLTGSVLAGSVLAGSVLAGAGGAGSARA